MSNKMFYICPKSCSKLLIRRLIFIFVMISSDVEPNYEVSRWKLRYYVCNVAFTLISNPLIYRVGKDSYEILVDAWMQITIRGANTDDTPETWINFMLHNWISVTMFFNFYFLISKLYLLCERMLITIRNLLLTSNNSTYLVIWRVRII